MRSDATMLEEPLDPPKAKQLIQQIIATGLTVPSRHALEEMAKDNLTMVDVTNVLRAGVVEPAEFENGSWRYRVRTQKMFVVVAFRSETELRVVTAWRVKQ